MTIAVTLFLLLWMTFTVWPFAPQYDGYDFFIYSIPILLPSVLLLLPLGMSFALRWAACRRFRRRRMRLHRASWLVFPACLLALLAANFYPWPLALRFAASRPWFDRAARQVSASGSISGSRMLGLFGVSKVSLWEPARVKFECSKDFDIHYDARVRPESPHYIVRISRDWYVWTEYPLYSNGRIRPPHGGFRPARSFA
jgi:hypothetical protein